jgi:hypothetical protein
MKELTGADRPLSCHGKAVDDELVWLTRRDTQNTETKIEGPQGIRRDRVAYHQFLPGEIQTRPLKGPVVNLDLSAPHRLVQWQNGRTRSGLVATKDAAITPAGMPGYWRTDAASEDRSMLLEESVTVKAGGNGNDTLLGTGGVDLLLGQNGDAFSGSAQATFCAGPTATIG